MTVTPGIRLDHYEIISPLGAGGMGEVWLARDQRLQRDVAIKILPAEFSRDAERLRRFAQEARAASQLNHPNIITIYEIGEHAGVHYIVTEMIIGETLRALIKKQALDLPAALAVAIQMAAALQAAHTAGIIHRDIKSENVMQRPDGYIKVLDFGLARIGSPVSRGVDSEAATLVAGLTAPGVILGTLHYMSPEQTRGLPLDARTDIFSLGVVLYEMLTGSLPFQGSTPSDIIAAILTTEPAPLTQSLPHAPEELQRILNCCLHKEREKRYQSISDLLTDLNALREDLAFSAKHARQTDETLMQLTRQMQAAPASVTVPHRVSWRTLWLILLPILLVTAGLLWWLKGRRNHPVINPALLKSTEVASWQSAPGEVYSLGTFSPDGRMIAFISTRSGTRNVWIKQAASEAVQVTKDEFDNNYPVWAPNGEEIAYFSLRGNQYGIWRIPILGGTPQLITTLAEGEGSVRLIAWDERDQLYYESRQNLFRLELKSGQKTQLTDLPSASVTANSFSLSPDKQQIAWLSPGADGTGNLLLKPIAGGEPKQLTRDAGKSRNTVWHPDGKRILYSADMDGIYQIFVADTEGVAPTQITFGDRDSYVLDVSADGTRVLVSSSQEMSDVWRVTLPKGEEQALASDISAELWPAGSPDGRTIAYQSIHNLSQGNKLFNGSLMLRQTGSEALPIRLVADGFLPQWSPDGQHLAYLRVQGEEYSLWVIGAAGGTERKLSRGEMPSVEMSLVPYNRLQTSSFAWSPDSRRIAYITKQENQRNLHTVAVDGSDDQRITGNDDANLRLYCPLWSADGQQIAITTKTNKADPQGNIAWRVLLANASTKETRVVMAAQHFIRLLGWLPADKELLLATVAQQSAPAQPDNITLVRVTLSTGEVWPLTTLSSTYLYNLALSADKRTVAFVARQDGRDNIYLLPQGGRTANKLTNNSDPGLYLSSLAWSPNGTAIYFGKQSRHSLISQLTGFH